MEIITPFINNAGSVILLILLWKSGLLKFLLEKNGNGKSDLEKEIKEIKENHLHDIEERLIAIETKLNIIMNHLKI